MIFILVTNDIEKIIEVQLAIVDILVNLVVDRLLQLVGLLIVQLAP